MLYVLFALMGWLRLVGSLKFRDRSERHESFSSETHCNTLQHIATRCNTLLHAGTHCNTLQQTATRHNTLQHAATHCNTLQHTATRCNTLLHAATRSNTLQHIATHCNTLQHTATYRRAVAEAELAVECVCAGWGRSVRAQVHLCVLQRVGACCSVLQRVAV